MKVLAACEESGIVRDAFLALGHDAMSCDILPTMSEGPHYQGDVRDILNDGWDLMLAFPPCTYLSSSGMHWTTRGLRDPQLTEDALELVQTLLDAPIPAIQLENPVGIISSRIRKPDQTIQPWQFGHNASKKTCLWLKGLQPLTFSLWDVVPPTGWEVVRNASDMDECDCCGEPFCPLHQEHYADCPCIGPTEDDVTYKANSGVLFGTRLDPAPKQVWANQTPSGQNKLGPSENRARLRGYTYEGIAEAMALQFTAQLSH